MPLPAKQWEFPKGSESSKILHATIHDHGGSPSGVDGTWNQEYCEGSSKDLVIFMKKTGYIPK